MSLNNVIGFERRDGELLPCPFCGCSEVVYVRYLHPVGERYAVWCTGCMAEMDPGYAQDRHTVKAMWNRRTSNA